MKLSLNARARVVAESYLTAVRACSSLIRRRLTRYPSSMSEVPTKAWGNIYHSGSAVCLMLELPNAHPSLCKVSAVGRNMKCTSPVAGTNGRYGNDAVDVGHNNDARKAYQDVRDTTAPPMARHSLPNFCAIKASRRIAQSAGVSNPRVLQLCLSSRWLKRGIYRLALRTATLCCVHYGANPVRWFVRYAAVQGCVPFVSI